MESLTEHELSEDECGVEVLSGRSVLFKLLHFIPVLQRQSDLRQDNFIIISRLPYHLERSVGRVADLLGRRGRRLAVVQAVQQIESPHSDLEAERRQEEGAGRVQNETTERSTLVLYSSAAAQHAIILKARELIK